MSFLVSQRLILSASRWLPITGLVVASLAIGWVIVPDFGVSWDETADAAYGADSLRAYGNQAVDWEAYPKRKYYGPAHFMLQNLAVPLITDLRPDFGEPEVRRIVNWLAFQVAIGSMYLLTLQLVGNLTALATALVFATQPLLFGHGFINGKDTPFLALFLLSISLGLAAVRSLPDRPAVGDQRSHWRRDISRDYAAASARSKLLLGLSALLLAAVVSELLVFDAVIEPFAVRMVRQAYSQQAPSPVNQLFDLLAENRESLPIDPYVLRTTGLLDIARWPLGALAAVPVLLSLWHIFTSTRKRLRRLLGDDLAALRSAPFQQWTTRGHMFLLLAAGLAVGLATSVRIVGLLAMFLIGLLYLAKLRSRALPPLVVYGTMAGAICLATWPFLWADPIGRLLESYQFLVSGPNRDYVLFVGEVSKGNALPWYFLPSLMLIQLTEPVWLLAIGSVVLMAFGKLRTRLPSGFGAIMVLWVTMPTVPLILQGAWFYDNFRQFHFVTPVFLILGAYGLKFTLDHARVALVRAALIALVLVPGVVQVVRLHPYQYVYYNGFVGGTRSAARQFEMDYWATSYAEATRYLNIILPPGSTVAYWATAAAARPVARSDLNIQTFVTEEDLYANSADVAVMITRANIDLGILASIQPLHEVTVGDALLAVIKVVPTAQRSEQPPGSLSGFSRIRRP